MTLQTQPLPRSISPLHLALLIAKASGDKSAVAVAQANFNITEEGITALHAQGRHIEAMLAKAFAANRIL